MTTISPQPGSDDNNTNAVSLFTPLPALFSKPHQHDVQISPRGRQLGYLERKPNNRRLRPLGTIDQRQQTTTVNAVQRSRRVCDLPLRAQQAHHRVSGGTTTVVLNVVAGLRDVRAVRSGGGRRTGRRSGDAALLLSCRRKLQQRSGSVSSAAWDCGRLLGN